MKRIIFFAMLSLTQITFAADTENSPLIPTHGHILDTIVLEDALTLQQAYEKKVCASGNGQLICVNSNLISCDGLSKLKNTSHWKTITKCEFYRNKISHLHRELFTELPNLEHLNLSDNNIGTLCTPIPQHQNLKTFYLNKNNLTEFPFQAFLTNIPVKQLRLDENQITDYGKIHTDLPSLEELWLDPTIKYIPKTQIVQHCTNLVAEICEGDDTPIQDAHTKVEYNQKCLGKCVGGTLAGAVMCGVTVFFGNLVFALPCIFINACNHGVLDALPNGWMIPTLLLGGCGTGAVLGSCVGLSMGLYRTKPDERYTVTILKQIATYPPMIEKLKQQTQQKTIANQ